YSSLYVLLLLLLKMTFCLLFRMYLSFHSIIYVSFCLLCNGLMYVDGGHVKDKDREKRSFEALLAAVFKADSYKKAANSNTAIP
ncbi:hypothetical protein, partial [Candidatus Bandiella numerosa]|uniref:hypothetical protein n=1 Tax=Candidatus Bandiella numerosa TaxID=2570586 RepID=UPI001F161C2C